MEGVLRTSAVGRGIGERTDDLQELEDPSVANFTRSGTSKRSSSTGAAAPYGYDEPTNLKLHDALRRGWEWD
jgi:hypothetical protein